MKMPTDIAKLIAYHKTYIGEYRTFYLDWNGNKSSISGHVLAVDGWYVHLGVNNTPGSDDTIIWHEAIVAIR